MSNESLKDVVVAQIVMRFQNDHEGASECGAEVWLEHIIDQEAYAV